MSRRHWWGLALAAALAACDGGPSPLDPGFQAGPLDVSRVVAVGDGFAAGAMDDALYRSGQEASVLALFTVRALAREAPVQPLVADPGFGITDPAGGRLTLAALFPPRLVRPPRGGPVLTAAHPQPFDNLGVPLATVGELRSARSAATSTFGNPFFDVVLRDRGTAVEQAAELDPSLILLWAGTADVLLFAQSGGDPDLVPGLPTPSGTFELAYAALLDDLTAVTDAVVLFDVPDVAALPLVTAVPPHVVDPLTGEVVEITVFEPVFDPVTGDAVIDPETGDTLRVARQRPMPLLGPDGPLASTDQVPLTAAGLIAEGIGVPVSAGGTGVPLPDRAVLNRVEREAIAAAVSDYNTLIREFAEERGLALVRVSELFADLQATGVLSDGVRLTAAWPAGQAISLDGTRFTAKGYALVVNRMIDALNARYGSRLLHIRTADLPGRPLF